MGALGVVLEGCNTLQHCTTLQHTLQTQTESVVLRLQHAATLHHAATHTANTNRECGVGRRGDCTSVVDYFLISLFFWCLFCLSRPLFTVGKTNRLWGRWVWCWEAW